jgi:2-oxoglutarate ferredoxin oxidoreductase subunit alpha
VASPLRNDRRRVNLQGNHACALGAIAAGCRFYAGYPITPSSEIAERMAVELPKVGGVFIQMEDEIASMGAVIGASMGGAKAMTATSGPGFSLKQENLGYGIMVEVPCVVVDVMRGGPSTGMPTRPAQGDIMQARWGTHGDHPIVVLAPASVAEIFDETIRAFSLSEILRTPVVVLYDEVVGHLVETVELPDPDTVERAERRWATGPRETYLPFSDSGGGIPAMARPGDGYRCHTTGLTHGENGFPTQMPDEVDAVTRRLLGKLDRHRDRIDLYETLDADDAEVLVIAIGIAARAARRAVILARARGIAAGLFRPLTLWPFPETQLRALAGGARALLVPEMNAGQLSLEVERVTGQGEKIARLNRLTGEPILPSDILTIIEELARHGRR